MSDHIPKYFLNINRTKKAINQDIFQIHWGKYQVARVTVGQRGDLHWRPQMFPDHVLSILVGLVSGSVNTSQEGS